MITAHLSKNKTKISNEEINYLLQLTVGFVNKLVKDVPDRHYRVEIGEAKFQHFGTHYDFQRLIRANFSMSGFPYNSTYAKYKDMPTHEIKTWQENLVSILGHELAHSKYSYQWATHLTKKVEKRQAAEFACELCEADCVAMFRKEKVQLAYQNFLNKLKEKQERKKIVKSTVKKVLSDNKVQERKNFTWLRNYLKKNNIEKSHPGKTNFYITAPMDYVFGSVENGKKIYCHNKTEAFDFVKKNPLIKVKIKAPIKTKHE